MQTSQWTGTLVQLLSLALRLESEGAVNNLNKEESIRTIIDGARGIEVAKLLVTPPC